MTKVNIQLSHQQIEILRSILHESCGGIAEIELRLTKVEAECLYDYLFYYGNFTEDKTDKRTAKRILSRLYIERRKPAAVYAIRKAISKATT